PCRTVPTVLARGGDPPEPPAHGGAARPPVPPGPPFGGTIRGGGWTQTLKYFASGWWTTIVSVDCSGCSCISSDSSTPIRDGSSRRTTLARSARSGQAG